MTFLNATLLIGCLAAALPIVLHFLGKREPQRVVFPAVRFLTKRMETTRRRVQVKRWVLLVMRVGLILAFALALAQPEVHRIVVGRWLGIGLMGLIGVIVVSLAMWALVTDKARAVRLGLLGVGLILVIAAGLWGGATVALGPKPESGVSSPAAIVILIDNGPTSDYRLAAEQSRLDRAKDWAKWVLSRYPSESRIAILDRSSRPVTFSLDAASAQKGLQKLTVLQNPLDLTDRIVAGAELLRTSQLARKVLFVFSDLSEASWGTTSGTTTSGTGQERLQMPAKLQDSPSIFLQVVDVGSDDFRNRFIRSMEISDSTPPRETTTSVSLVIDRESNAAGIAGNGTETGDAAAESLTIQMRLYATEPGLPVYRDEVPVYPALRTVDRQMVRLDARGAKEVFLTLPPLPAGYHHGMVEIVEPDAMRLDDIRYFTVKVAQPRRVLVVADDFDERKVISLMLNPRGQDDPRREYDIEFTASRTLQDKSFEDYAAIGLFNPSSLVPLAQDRLENWVRAGGSLFVALGPEIGESGASEVSQWSLVGRPQRIWRVPEPGTYMQVVQASHPSLTSLASVPGGAPWSAFRVYNYWQLEDEARFQPLLRFAGREHLGLGERRLDQGRVIVMTTPVPALTELARSWNELLSSTTSGAWEVYLILISQIFEDLTGGKQADLNSQVGTPVALTLETSEPRRWQLFAPGTSAAAIDSEQNFVVPGVPTLAGTYWLRSTDAESIGYSVNLASDETRLGRVDKSTLDDLFGEENYALASERERIEFGGEGATDGRPIYSFVMLAVFSLFTLESILANYFYRRDRETEDDTRSGFLGIFRSLKGRIGSCFAARGIG